MEMGATVHRRDHGYQPILLRLFPLLYRGRPLPSFRQPVTAVSPGGRGRGDHPAERRQRFRGPLPVLAREQVETVRLEGTLGIYEEYPEAVTEAIQNFV